MFVDQSLEMDMVDCLMTCSFATGFTLSKVSGFSREHMKLDKTEQVAGCRQVLKIEVVVEQSDTQQLTSLLAGLNGRFPIRYIISPILEQGVISHQLS
jgi:hypothetical protein